MAALSHIAPIIFLYSRAHSVMINWEIEFKRWCPGLKILVYHGSMKERRRKRQGWNNPNSFGACFFMCVLLAAALRCSLFLSVCH